MNSVVSTLLDCAQEPIRIPGSIQPHGFLLVLDVDSLVITHASENVDEFLHQAVKEILGQAVGVILGKELDEWLRHAADDSLFAQKPLRIECAISIDGVSIEDLEWVAHRRDDRLILEGERISRSTRGSVIELHARIGSIVSRMEAASSVEDLCQFAAREFRLLTGFDRAMIYQFDEEWNGTVVAQDRNEQLPSYLDYRFPSTDIPQQARELYRLSRLRLIATCDYSPVRLVANSKQNSSLRPVDLSLSTLRNVSPIHLQYMRNMGTASSMSISIMRGERLWGLISCHHRRAHIVPLGVRSVGELLGQVFSLQLAARERTESFAYRTRLQSILTDLLTRMSQGTHFTEALGVYWEEALAFVSASGLAVVSGENCLLRGLTPPAVDVRRLSEWLSEKEDMRDLFFCDDLPEQFPPAKEFVKTGSGIMAFAVSRVHTSFVIWFRPEIIKTITWGGEPGKMLGSDPDVLNPRKSFESWQQVVSARSTPWRKEEVEAAREFRNALLAIVLKRAEEMAALTKDLAKANQELAQFSYSISHDLRAPFRHIQGYAQILKEEKHGVFDETTLEMLDRILFASAHAAKLVDNLLSFSQMGTTVIAHEVLRMNELIAKISQQIVATIPDRKIDWVIHSLPDARGDRTLICQVWYNLIENAVKYSKTRIPARIEILATEDSFATYYSIIDNGVGFDMRHIKKLFEVFQRLHGAQDFDGIGIGLANVRRIVERHGGEVSAKGRLGEGATFQFSLPKIPLINRAILVDSIAPFASAGQNLL